MNEAEAKQRAAEEAARKKAEEAARIEAEEAARKQAEAEARQRAAEEAARRNAAIKEAARRKSEAEKAERLALEEEARYLAAAKAARIRAEDLHRKAEEAEQMAALQLDPRQESLPPSVDQSTAEEEATPQPAAPEPAAPEPAAPQPAAPQPAAPQPATPQRADAGQPIKSARKPVSKVIRTGVELPAKKQLTPTTPTTGKRSTTSKRVEPGAPNLFNLTAFRNTEEIKQRGPHSQRQARAGLWTALATGIVLLSLALRLGTQQPPEILTGPDAIATNSNGDLLLVAGDNALLHDRSGSAREAANIAVRTADGGADVLIFKDSSEVLISGTLDESSNETALLRCKVNEPSCAPALADNPDELVSAAALHPRTNTLYIANSRDNLLRKYDQDGLLVAESSKELPSNPVLRLEDGLLLMNSSSGPAISVFRPDTGSFGKQLDEVLLLPPAAVEAEQSLVSDFLRVQASWWVTLENPETGQRGVYQYDTQWKYLNALPLPEGFTPEKLIAWGQKLLILDSSQPQVLRFSATGAPEVAFESTSLQELIASQTADARFTRSVTRLILATLVAILLCALIFAYLQRVRGLVYRGGNTRGAEPLEDYAEQLQWLIPEASRRSRFMQLAFLYIVGCIGALIAATGLTISALQLAALLIALAGPAISMLLLYRSPIGHIGTDGDTIALVDHNNLFHLGRDSRVHYRSRYLIIDDVVVFTGASLMPSFDRAQIAALKPLAEAGIKVERKAVWIKLLQARHPLALGAMVTGTCWLVCAILLLA